jgi:hypothetical protein
MLLHMLRSLDRAPAGDYSGSPRLLLPAPLQAKPARVLPQYDERSHSTSLDSHPIHRGADATGQSAIANDATAPTHRRRNPGESLHGGPTLPEPAIPPVAVDMSASLFVRALPVDGQGGQGEPSDGGGARLGACATNQQRSSTKGLPIRRC